MQVCEKTGREAPNLTPLFIYLRTLGTLCGFFSSFFLEFFPPEFDDRLVARRLAEAARA